MVRIRVMLITMVSAFGDALKVALRAIYPENVVGDVDAERGVQCYIGFSKVVGTNWVVGDGFPRERKET